MAAEKKYRDVLQKAGIEEDFVNKKSSLSGDQHSELDNSDDKYYEKYDDNTTTIYDEKTENKYEDSYSPDELTYSSVDSHKSSPMHISGSISPYSSNYHDNVTHSHTPSSQSESGPVYIEASDVEEDMDA